MIQDWATLREAISREYAANPDTFLRQPMVTRILAPNQPALARLYADDLMATTHGQSLLARARDPEQGMPRRYVEAGGCSMVAAQHAWQLSKLWEILNVVPVNLRYIAEVGAGYGDLCRQIHAAGFSGTYSIFDLYELREMQRRYLAACGVRCKTIALPLDMDDPDPGQDSLLVATFSIAEMPLGQRQFIEPCLMGYRFLMLSWNESFAGIDNMAWFNGLAARLAGHYKVDIMKDPHMRAWYLFAKARR